MLDILTKVNRRLLPAIKMVEQGSIKTIRLMTPSHWTQWGENFKVAKRCWGKGAIFYEFGPTVPTKGNIGNCKMSTSIIEKQFLIS